MDIIPKFYIFGVPDGFDMLDGTSAETTYFLKFYNGSTENTKYSIHRDAKGNFTYTYLKYNLSSGKSRTGSFFGMSLIFPNAYTSRPLGLYELFDWVYHTYILIDEKKEKKGNDVGFIRPVKGNKDIQAMYEITRFEDKRDYIRHYIEGVLLGNINDRKFKDNFYLTDSSFGNEHPNLVAQEPMETISDEKLLANLRLFNRVAVSPDWKPQSKDSDTDSRETDISAGPTVTLAPEYIVSLLDYTKRYQNYIIDSLNDIASADMAEVHAVYDEVAARLHEVKTTFSADKRIPQIIRDYTTLTEQLQNLIQKIEECPTPPPPPPTPWWKNPKILGLAGGGAGLVILLVLLVINNLPKDENTIDRTPFIEGKIRYYIAEGDYQTALTLAEDSLKAARYHHFQDTIADIQTLTRIDSLIQPDKRRYSDAWELSKELNDNTTQANTQQKLSSQCLSYLKELTENAKDAKSAQATKSIINNCKVVIDQTEKDKMITKLDAIIQAAVKSSGSTSSAPSSVPQYKVILYKSNRRFNEKEGTPIDVTTTQKTITCQNGDRYVYYIEDLNGVAINDPNCIQAPSKLKCLTKMGLGWYGIGEAGTIKVKKGNFECEITIKYEQ